MRLDERVSAGLGFGRNGGGAAGYRRVALVAACVILMLWIGLPLALDGFLTGDLGQLAAGLALLTAASLSVLLVAGRVLTNRRSYRSRH